MAELVRDRIVSAAEAAQLATQVSKAFSKAQALPAHVRAKVLLNISEGLEKDAEAFARLIAEEVKKPLKEARREVGRAVFCFRWASEEAKRLVGELLPLDIDASSEGRFALTKRVATGPALLITPFNFPLNLVAHKAAPAIAAGMSFVLKPAPQAPRTALRLAKLIKDAGYPADCFAVVSCPIEAAEALVRDARFAVLSFTGSSQVGWHLKAIAGKKKVLLELGGNAGVFVAKDADVPWAAARCAWGAFYYSGQVCISVQRIFVEAPVYAEFKDLFLKNVAELKAGDPLDEKTDIAPLIDENAAKRVDSWIQEAVRGGGKVLCGGTREGDFVPATVVEDAPESCKLSCEEVFGPVATLARVGSREEALEKIAAGPYGLQAGVFTNDLKGIIDAWTRLPVGGLIINDIPSYRCDAMPYGGMKDSGVGREGVRYALQEFTELKTLVVKP